MIRQSPEARKRKKVQAQRMILIRPVILQLDKFKCRALTDLPGLFPEDPKDYIGNVLEMAHILPRDVRHPERDEPWNLIMLRRIIHAWFDGRQKNPWGMDHKTFQVIFLLALKQSNPTEFRWQPALDEIIKPFESIPTIKPGGVINWKR